MPKLRCARAIGLIGLLLTGPALAQQAPPPAKAPPAVAASGIGRIPFAERPVRSTDSDQETLALQMLDSLGMACRGHEMYRWNFGEDDFPRAQRIVALGERALKDRGYSVNVLPVEVDTLTAMHARLSARGAPDGNILALWYVADQGVDLTLCRVR